MVEASPSRPLPRIVLLEDDPDDATLIIRELTKARLAADTQWVRNRSDFLLSLETEPDLILSDYSIPGYGGMTALADVRQRWPESSFIMVSGALGDEAAAQCIKLGVTDYLLKDRLSRLVPAVTNALEERWLRAERRAAAERLQQSQKLEAVGRLAGGIAHDFNNVLTAISGWVELLLESEPLTERAADVLREIGAAGDRARRLTQQLLLFSRKRVPERQPLDLNALVARLADMLRRLLGATVRLELSLHEHLSAITADSGMLEQVIVNLAVNARDAMPSGGVITIETAPAHGKQPPAGSDYGSVPPNLVRLTVRDQGCGIAPELRACIFEPFFTTKEPGKGTGMGLATVLGIVQQHQGWIELESVVGRGTAFHLFLPASLMEPPPVRAARLDAAPRPGGRETILCIEDEAVVRRLLESALRKLGYHILIAEDGPSALKRWHEQRGHIDLVVTDVVMPGGMTGFDVAKALRAEDSHIPILFTSGFQDRVARGACPEMSTHSAFLHKPYPLGKLAATVRQLLDEAAGVASAGKGTGIRSR